MMMGPFIRVALKMELPIVIKLCIFAKMEVSIEEILKKIRRMVMASSQQVNFFTKDNG
jgi:hypothetical protein